MTLASLNVLSVDFTEEPPFTVAPGCGQTRSNAPRVDLASASPGLDFDPMRELPSFRPLLLVMVISLATAVAVFVL